MVDNGTGHWTDDDDLVSRFVMRQLSQSEETRLSSHLDTCERCRQVVRQETLFAARMKRGGRNVMKERLHLLLTQSDAGGTGLRSSPRGHIPWVRIAGVAAVAVIIVVVGVYNNWLGRDHRTSGPTIEPMAQEQPTMPHDTAVGLQDARGSHNENRPGTSITQSTKPLDKTDGKKATPAPATMQPQVAGKKETAVQEQLELAQSDRRPKAEESVADQMLHKDEEKQTAHNAMSIPAQTYWVEGHVLSARDDAGQSFLKSFPSPSRLRDHAKEKIDLQGAATRSSDDMTSQVSLQQQPLSSLPLALRGSSNRHGTIPALIESRDRGILLTLFLDSPVPDSEFRAADVRMIDSDSLLVVLPHQLIGLTLPRGVSNKVNSNAKEVK